MTSTVVIGAGLSGLTAAYRLARAGGEVIVLEARQRVGGRAWRVEVADGVSYDGGCEAVDDAHTALLELAEELGVETVRVDRWANDRRPPLEGDDVALFEALETEIAALAARIDPNHPEELDGAADVDAQTLGGWLAERGASQPLLETAETWYSIASSTVPIADTSLLHYASKVAAGAATHGLELRLVGGPSAVAGRLAEELGDRVSLGKQAVALEQDGGGVRVRLADGSVVEGERAVLAVPLTMQRRVRFDPPLPTFRTEALAQARYGEVIKAAALHDEPPALPDEQVTRDGVVYRSHDDGRLLVVFAGAAAARRPDRVRALAGGEARAYRAVDWSEEPFTRGSYLILGPGQLLSWGRRLGEPHGRIHFGGAEASPLPSYMNGAVLAGERAAAEIIEAS